MRLAIIGRAEWLYDSAERLLSDGHEIGLVITAREAPEYRRTSEDFQRLAAQHGARFFHTVAKDTPEVLAAIEGAGDLRLGVSMNFPGIVSAEVIARFPLGILNAHGGDLPRYRGNACQAWAMLNGEARIALCVHRMVGGELDTGDIVARTYRPLAIDDRIGDVFTWLGREAPALFSEAVAKLDADPAYVLERQSRAPADALRCYPRTPEDGRIDWRDTSEQVLRLINASSEPFAGAYCSYEGNRLTIWRARLTIDDEKYLAVPGQVAAVNAVDGSVTVICGDGKLRITQVGCDGRRFAPATLIRSTRKRLS
jgi:UDP-4-amino-4-deoxy-L-arabinose formyltransferase/UDP-glucuronic acid dehydrogenase (UDP-4-keto-hexauronic acid decarboxylating)